MDFQLIAAIVFCTILAGLIFWERKNIEFSFVIKPIVYFAKYKTKLGLKLMDRMAAYKKTCTFLGYLGIVLGFLGMILLEASLIVNVYKLLFVENAPAGVGIVQPFADNVPGTIYVPFFHFIISLTVLIVIHEFAHGLIARLYNIKVKSSGVGVVGLILPIIPLAFVEPDEKQIVKAKKREQLAIFAAGPLANFLCFGLVYALLLFGASPFTQEMVIDQGVIVQGFEEGYPAESSGLIIGERITSIDGTEITTLEEFIDHMQSKKSGEQVQLTTNLSMHTVTLTDHPNQMEHGYMGIYANQDSIVKEHYKKMWGGYFFPFFGWFLGLLTWLAFLNLGIGLMNLAPMGPVDGGQMLRTVLIHFLPEKKAYKIWAQVGWFTLLLVILNIVLPFVV